MAEEAEEESVRRRVCSAAFASSVVFRIRPSTAAAAAAPAGADRSEEEEEQEQAEPQPKRRRRSRDLPGSDEEWKEEDEDGDDEGGGKKGRRKRRASRSVQSYAEDVDMEGGSGSGSGSGTGTGTGSGDKDSDLSLPKGLMKERTMDVLKKSGKRKFRYLIVLPGQLQAVAADSRLGHLDRMDSMNPVLYLDIAPAAGDGDDGKSKLKKGQRRRLKLQGSIVHPKSTLISLRVSPSEAVCEDVFDTAIVFGEVSEEVVEEEEDAGGSKGD